MYVNFISAKLLKMHTILTLDQRLWNLSTYHTHLESVLKHWLLGPPPTVSDPIGLGWGLGIWTSSWGLLLLWVWEPPFEEQCIDTMSNGKGCFFCFPQYGSRNHTNAQCSTNRLTRHHYDKEGGSNKHSSSDDATAQAAVTFYWSLLCNYVTMYSVMCFDDHLM